MRPARVPIALALPDTAAFSAWPWLVTAALVAVLMLSLGCAAPHAPGPDCPTCLEGDAGSNVWCPTHQVGFVSHVVLDCQGCFNARIVGSTCRLCDGRG